MTNQDEIGVYYKFLDIIEEFEDDPCIWVKVKSRIYSEIKKLEDMSKLEKGNPND